MLSSQRWAQLTERGGTSPTERQGSSSSSSRLCRVHRVSSMRKPSSSRLWIFVWGWCSPLVGCVVCSAGDAGRRFVFWGGESCRRRGRRKGSGAPGQVAGGEERGQEEELPKGSVTARVANRRCEKKRVRSGRNRRERRASGTQTWLLGGGDTVSRCCVCLVRGGLGQRFRGCQVREETGQVFFFSRPLALWLTLSRLARGRGWEREGSQTRGGGAPDGRSGGLEAVSQC